MSSVKKILNSTMPLQSNEWLFRYEKFADPRTKDWPLVSSYRNVTLIVISYLLTVSFLPKICTRFKPLKLKKTLIVYNIGMAVFNLYVFKEFLVNVIELNYKFLCQDYRIDYSTHEMKLASITWMFFISKIVEFSDTLFFILRHKWNQLTLLHIYHHSTITMIWWIATKWVPTGSSFFLGLINSFVHVIMYSYYGLSVCGPRIQKYLWWKKYLTALQLTQFVIDLVWATQAIIWPCDYPSWVNYITVVYMIILLILFGQFYVKEYRSKKEIKHK